MEPNKRLFSLLMSNGYDHYVALQIANNMLVEEGVSKVYPKSRYAARTATTWEIIAPIKKARKLHLEHLLALFRVQANELYDVGVIRRWLFFGKPNNEHFLIKAATRLNQGVSFEDAMKEVSQGGRLLKFEDIYAWS